MTGVQTCALPIYGDDAEFDVIADVKIGLFGRVKEEARVRARVAPATPRAKDDRRRGRGRGAKSGAGRGQRSRGQAAGQSERTGAERKSGNSGGGRSSGSRNRKGSASSGAGGKNGDNKQGDRSDNRRANSRGEKREKSMNDTEATGADSTVSDSAMSDSAMSESAMSLPQQADLAEAFVRGLAERFGTTIDFAREDIDEEEIRITVSGDDLGRMIGRRGTTAGAIDELVRTVLQRQAGSSRNGRIRVDIGGVRARRAEALANFSRAQAEEVRSSGAARSLEPMSAADRKVVHDALSDEAGVDTVSEGEDSQRRVVIVPDGADD